MNATKQPMDTWAMIETAKRIMSADAVVILADNVVISRRFNDDGDFEAVCFTGGGKVLLGLWSPDRDWQHPTDITSGETGTFVRNR